MKMKTTLAAVTLLLLGLRLSAVAEIPGGMMAMQTSKLSVDTVVAIINGDILEDNRTGSGAGSENQTYTGWASLVGLSYGLTEKNGLQGRIGYQTITLKEHLPTIPLSGVPLAVDFVWTPVRSDSATAGLLAGLTYTVNQGATQNDAQGSDWNIIPHNPGSLRFGSTVNVKYRQLDIGVFSAVDFFVLGDKVYTFQTRPAGTATPFGGDVVHHIESGFQGGLNFGFPATEALNLSLGVAYNTMLLPHNPQDGSTKGFSAKSIVSSVGVSYTF